jgi:acyl-CoA reductase-like NAD-dependent aldehyde dehydrogenase
MRTEKIFIAGSWSESSLPLPVLDPYTGQAFARTFLAEPAQVEKALSSAQDSFEKIKKLTSAQRNAICLAVTQKLGEKKEDFARLIVAEAGKPLTDARREVQRALSVFQEASQAASLLESRPLPLEFPPGQENRQARLGRFPLGTVLCVTPFNFSLNLVAHKVAPAIAFGCPFILKPSPKAPLTSLLLARVLLEAGLPPESFSVFPADNGTTEKMTVDPRVKVLSFTGSAAVGWKLKGLVPQKKVLLELGGNAAVVVEPDANLDFALARIVAGGFGYSGQTCISVQRVFVAQSLFQKFLDRLVPMVKALVSGDPAAEKTQVGPMISEDAAKRVEGWVNEAVAGGAQILCGGNRNGSFYEPTVLTRVKPEMKVSCEELFGPVVVVEPYPEFAEALRRVNGGPYGLQAGVFTRDQAKARQAYETLEVGTVLINEVPTYRVDAMPYGGVKESGFGREGVSYVLEDYTEPRLLIINP